jgi:SAM-dependent methyltransferase
MNLTWEFFWVLIIRLSYALLSVPTRKCSRSSYGNRNPNNMSFWKKTYYPPPQTDRLAGHGDYGATRVRFNSKKHSNLKFLIRERYTWMNPYLIGKDRVVELGSGPGLSREFIDSPHLELTDILANEWIDRQVDATALPYSASSLDAVICSHMIHHVATPAALIAKIQQVLKPGGVLLINESKASLLHRLLMWSMRHEGWSYEVDLFDQSARTKESDDPLAGNNAIGDLLFDNHQKFEAAFPSLSITRDEFVETFIFLVSCGVGGEVFTVTAEDPLGYRRYYKATCPS